MIMIMVMRINMEGCTNYKFDTLMPGLRNFAIFAILHAHGIISLAPLLRFNLNL